MSLDYLFEEQWNSAVVRGADLHKAIDTWSEGDRIDMREVAYDLTGVTYETVSIVAYREVKRTKLERSHNVNEWRALLPEEPTTNATSFKRRFRKNATYHVSFRGFTAEPSPKYQTPEQQRRYQQRMRAGYGRNT